MTAHIVYPQIDAKYPATLSHALLGDLLRGEWRYEGVVITDSLGDEGNLRALRSRTAQR